MRIASLGSGSRGNGTLIEDGDTCLLVDLGFSLKEDYFEPLQTQTLFLQTHYQFSNPYSHHYLQEKTQVPL